MQDRAKQALESLAADDRDLYCFSGLILRENVFKFIPILEKARQRSRSKASLVLTTHGGDANQAYRLARLFQESYGGAAGFRLVVVGPCKSAGTLVSLGAAEIAMGPLGELGPLDVQLAKRDEIALHTSGLDTLGALATMQSEAFNTFERCMLTIVERSNRTVSTKTACDIAATIVSGLFQPIASQIDPHRLSTVNRMMAIAEEYAKRLGMQNLKERDTGRLLDRLVRGYPTHEFIIDRGEASDIFERVREPTAAERVVLQFCPGLVEYPEVGRETLICDVVDKLETVATQAVHREDRGGATGTGKNAGARSDQGAGGEGVPQEADSGSGRHVAPFEPT